MKMTFRWYGPEADPITLENIRQIPGTSGIMGAMDWIPVGEVWSNEEISSYIRKVNEAGLECEVIESVNVHEDIKLGKPSRDSYIISYCKTLENLAAYGIKVVVYNFMPVFDWLRTELFHRNGDGSTCLYYDHEELEGLTPQDIVKATLDSSAFPLPGWEPERLADLDGVMAQYTDMTPDQVRDNYRYFLE